MHQRDLFDKTTQMVNLDRRSVEFDDEQRFRLARIANMDKILRRLDRGLIHHFHAARNDARRDNAGDAGPRRFAGVESNQHRPCGFRGAQDADRHFGHDAEHPLGSRDQREEIVASLIEMAAAQPDDFAGHQNHFDAQEIIGGETIFEAVNATRILGHIAADRAGDLRGGIGRVIKALSLDRPCNGEIGDARLDDGKTVGEVDFLHLVEFHHRNQNAVLEWQGAA